MSVCVYMDIFLLRQADISRFFLLRQADISRFFLLRQADF